MLFDKILMNPPYDGNLHLKCVERAIKLLKDNDSKCVNLSPVRWLQDPLAKYKKNSDYNKFENSIAKHIKELVVISAHDANEMFKIETFLNLGIYTLSNKENKFNYKDFWMKSRTALEVKTIENLQTISSIASKVEKYKRQGIRVPLTNIAGNRGNKPVYKDISYTVDGYINGKDWTKCKNMGGYYKPENSPFPLSIQFNSEVEANNFYKSWFTSFLSWICNITCQQQNIQFSVLPYLGDIENPRTHKMGYESDWTNEDLCKVFNITEDEWKSIEETMKPYI